MNTKRKCQVVLLSTSQQPLYNNIVTSPRYPNMIQKFGSFENSYPDECKVHHLYITSDEEIKEDDWYIGDNIIYNLVTKTNGMNPQKIISTTNPALNLPQPSKSFIDKYIEEYNAGNPITEVMVEYELDICKRCNGKGTEIVAILGECNCLKCKGKGILSDNINLKVNPDNTINIKPIKDNWSREEVKQLCKLAFKYHCDNSRTTSLPDKWIEDNL